MVPELANPKGSCWAEVVLSTGNCPLKWQIERHGLQVSMVPGSFGAISYSYARKPLWGMPANPDGDPMVLKRGDQGAQVKVLQEGLIHVGLLPAGSADGKFGPKTEAAAEAWQESQGLYGDGIVGPLTVKAWNAALPAAYRLTAAPSPTTTVVAGSRLKTVRVTCDTLGSNGYSSMRMREDVAARYNALRAELVALGSGITSAGSIRPLGNGGGSAQSAVSMHYPGLAWDLALGSGMQRTSDPYLVENLGDRKWRVWAKCKPGAVPDVTVQATICSTVLGKTRLKVVPVTGPYADFTAMAAKHGFAPIRGRRSFFAGGSYSGAEWWHFQCEGLLTHGVSTFGGELLRLYTEAEIKREFMGDWKAVRGYRFGIEWN
jgi:peptidoglycan hydrolase-like protein with peptidoglycan-binding domain